MIQVGIDEVGRGSWAGPLVIGAVSLTKPIIGLTDSKLLSINQREKLAKEIYLKSEYSSLGWVWPHEIDSLGLTKATRLAILRALSNLDPNDLEVILDGKYNFLGSKYRVKTIIKADMLIPSVSAASIIAKVARDNYMKSIDQYFSAYDFKNHVGYGTAKHRAALEVNGPCALHRISFRPVNKEVFNLI